MKMKKSLTLMMTIALIVSMMPFRAFAEETLTQMPDVLMDEETTLSAPEDPATVSLSLDNDGEIAVDITEDETTDQDVMSSSMPDASDTSNIVCESSGKNPLLLTKEEVQKRVDKSKGITEEKIMAKLLENAEKAHPGQTEISIGEDYTIDPNTRNIVVNKMKATLTDEVKKETNAIKIPLKDSYVMPIYDAILIHEKGGAALDTGVTLSSGNYDIYDGGNKLKKGSILLIIDKNGVIHGFYAGKVNGGNLTLGDKLNVYRCVAGTHFETDETNEITPSFILPALMFSWGDILGNITSISSEPGSLLFHIDISTGIYWEDWGIFPVPCPELLINKLSAEVLYPDVEMDVSCQERLRKLESILTVGFDAEGIVSATSSLGLSFDAKGEGTSKFDWSFEQGFKLACYYDGTVQIENADWIGSMPEVSNPSSRMAGDVYFGLAQEYEIGGLFDVVSINGELKAGFVNEGETSKGHVFPDDDERKYWHECEDHECVCGSGFSRLGPAELYWTLAGTQHDIISSPTKDSDPFFTYYDSITFDDRGSTTCPHKGYRLNTQVVNEKGQGLPEVDVSYTPVPAAHYEVPYSEKAYSQKTGSDGKAVLYAPKDTDMEVTASLKSKSDPPVVVSANASIKKTDDTQDMTLTLVIPEKHVYFKNLATGDVSHMPEDIPFTPFYSEDVTLPDVVPELSGRQFTGWNTSEDGTGTAYAPGTKLTLQDDLTLWAQWKIAGDDWYVIYNANGGTKAPEPQIIERGKDAVLSTERPQAGTMSFKGWTPDPKTLTPVYQPGDTLQYDSGKNYVVLYALWNLSPVPEPIHISFEANGVERASIPADVWMEEDSWYQLKGADAPLGSAYTFKGWSLRPDTKDPEFLAGRSYYFYHDTMLYAIWENLETRTLIFRDTQTGDASGMPDTITILPSESPNVKIPDQIPQKSGRVFTGWNTNKDGSGKNYAPGSVYTLNKNSILWAQWDKAENSWYVIYNANGGTKAPEPQIIERGKDAVITTKLPKTERMIFKGWTPDPRALTPVYQPGDTLRYDSGKNYVVLYALWSLSPAQRPILISFEANGGFNSSLPPDAWTERGIWLQLGHAVPALGSTYTFLGWSDDPGAKEPKYLAGHSYYFAQDTALFAIWKDLNTKTLTFMDPLPDIATAIPAPITVVPSMSQDVTIPDQIPEKSGRIFTGWNTARDGSGTDYAPGSVITLTRSICLWAQWKEAGNSWYIIYNAHGGTYAPRPQIIRNGVDATLTKELPEFGTMIFKGWTPDIKTLKPVYQPGAILPYDSSKNVVVLYAMWNINPAPKPQPQPQPQPQPDSSNQDGSGGSGSGGQPVPEGLFANYYVNGILVTHSKIGKQKQGLQGDFAFRLARGTVFTEAFTFNLSINDKADYTHKKGRIIMLIPLQYQNPNRAFAMVGLDRNCIPHYFVDIDKSPYTVTADIDMDGYAFDLVYVYR